MVSRTLGTRSACGHSAAPAKAEDFHALFLPGRAMTRERIKMGSDILTFVKHFMDSRKPVVALGASPAIILETGTVTGRIMKSTPSLRAELEGAESFAPVSMNEYASWRYGEERCPAFVDFCEITETRQTVPGRSTEG